MQDACQRRAAGCSRAIAFRLGWLSRQQRCDLSPQAIGKERSRHLRSTPESGARDAWDGHARARGSTLLAAVDTLGQVLAQHITPADADDSASAATPADAVQKATGDSVDLDYVDQGYTGERAAKAAADHGIAMERYWPLHGKAHAHRAVASRRSADGAPGREPLFPPTAGT